MIGQAGVGDTLRGPLACGQAGGLVFGPGLDRVVSLASVFVAPEIAIAYTAVDSYRLTIGGVVAATSPGPTIKAVSQSGLYDYFRQGSGEFEIYRNAGPTPLATVTIGRVSDQSRVCFYAVGGPSAYAAPTGATTRDFTGFADGLVIDAGENYRLFQSVTTARVDYATRQVTVRFAFRGREQPFRNFPLYPFSATTTATATVALDANGVFTGDLAADGYTGTFRGTLYGSTPGGMTIAFALRRSASDYAWGAAGLDAN